MSAARIVHEVCDKPDTCSTSTIIGRGVRGRDGDRLLFIQPKIMALAKNKEIVASAPVVVFRPRSLSLPLSHRSLSLSLLYRSLLPWTNATELFLGEQILLNLQKIVLEKWKGKGEGGRWRKKKRSCRYFHLFSVVHMLSLPSDNHHGIWEKLLVN